MGMPPFHEPGSDPVVVKDEHAVDGRVLQAVPLREDNTGREVSAGIFGEKVHDRDTGKIRLHHYKFPFADDLPVKCGVCEFVHHFFLVHAKRKRKRTPVSGDIFFFSSLSSFSVLLISGIGDVAFLAMQVGMNPGTCRLSCCWADS